MEHEVLDGFKNHQGSEAAADAKEHEPPNSHVYNAVKQYNLADFGETNSDATLFIIKSYIEDDVHKSIKYNVWVSTPSRNFFKKQLDAVNFLRCLET